MIGYYAHHHGAGHVTRATSIAAAMDEPVTVLSSRPRPSHSGVDWISLPLDYDDRSDDEYGDITAGGLAHWAPTGVRGATDRMAIIAEWIARVRPRLFVVDVSVEVALFVRLLGVKVVVVAMPGERTDIPHQTAYRIAHRILAPWSQTVYDPPWLHAYAAKTTFVGAMSRFDGRPREHASRGPDVLVLGGAGGASPTAVEVESAAAANPEYRWAAVGVGAGHWVEDVWPLLCSASVVVTHAGQNAVADVACARVPAIVVAQDRPFGEQSATASALYRAGAAVAVNGWPSDEAWPSLLDTARGLDPGGWSALNQPGAAGRAAAVLAGCA